MKKPLFEVEFYNNKKAKNKRLFFVVMLIICVAPLLNTVYEVFNSYKSLASLLRFVQPIFFGVLFYMQYKNEGIFNQYFRIMEDVISYNIDETKDVVTVNWQNITSIKIFSNNLVFATINNTELVMPLGYFNYTQIQTLKKVIEKACTERNIAFSI
jgi:hypothetical protein